MTDDVQLCSFDKVPVEICGGPHIEVETTLGTEVIKDGQEPVGTRISSLPKKEQQEHHEAEENAQ